MISNASLRSVPQLARGTLVVVLSLALIPKLVLAAAPHASSAAAIAANPIPQPPPGDPSVLIGVANDELARPEEPTALEDSMEHENLKYQLQRLENTFNSLEELLSKAVVKVQKVSSGGDLGDEATMKLSEFLNMPNNLTDASNIIESSLLRKLSTEEQEVLKHLSDQSLPKCVRALWQQHTIPHRKAMQIIHQHAPMTPNELIRLVNGGAAQTHQKYLVKLRTGKSYGDTLALFDLIARALAKIKNDPELAALSPTNLLTPPIRPEVIAAFGDASDSANDIISDASIIREMRRRFLFVSSIGLPIRFTPGIAGVTGANLDGPVGVSTDNFNTFFVTPGMLSAAYTSNYYFGNSAITNMATINPLGLNYTGGYAWNHAGGAMGVNDWATLSSGFFGMGLDFTVNGDNGFAWSNGQPSFMQFGAWVGGWRNNLMFGASMTTMLASGVGIGGTVQMSITRLHDVTYLGLYPMDGPIPSIRGLHKVQIDDTFGIGGQAVIAVSPSAASIPLTAAFKVGGNYTKSRVYRTHTDLLRTQDMLTESQIPGFLYIVGRKIKESRLPRFDQPENFKEGDEFVEKKSAT